MSHSVECDTKYLIWLADLDSWMTCTIEILYRRLKGVGGGAKDIDN